MDKEKTKMPANNRASALQRLREPWGRGPIPSLLSGMFGAAAAIRNAAYDSGALRSTGAGRPTISVGGLTAGGAGKTPMALLVGKYVQRMGHEAVFLSRGYGRKTKGPVVSAPMTIDSWKTVGDEPAMLHAALPQSWLGVCGDRLRAVSTLLPRLSSKAVFILDDAFQHRRIKRDLDIVCLPPAPLSDTLLPSGTLREPFIGLKRAHCVCLIGTAEERVLLEVSRQEISRRFPNTAVFILFQTPVGWINLSNGAFQSELPLKRPVAMCGIARPQRFIIFLKKMSISTSAEAIFSDHHEFREDEVASLVNEAGSSGIVTTEKDAFRLKSLKLVSCPDIWYLKLDLRFSDSDAEVIFYRFIDKEFY
jgi:tetraacyldisaccharide 4'-kinase